MRRQPEDSQDEQGDEQLAPDVFGSPEITPGRPFHGFGSLWYWDDFHTAAGGLNFGQRTFGDPVDAQLQGSVHFTTAQDGDRFAWVTQQLSFSEDLGGDFAARREGGELVQVDLVVQGAIDRGEAFTPHEWQAAVIRQVAALVVQATGFTGTSALTFGSTAGGFSPAGSGAAPNPHAIFLGRLLQVLDRVVS